MSWLNTETVSLILFFIGIAGMILRRNMMISVVSIGIMDAAIILFYVTVNVELNDMASVDPIPHALMITSIVIGVAVKAISLIMIIDLYNRYHTLDWDEAKKIRQSEHVG